MKLFLVLFIISSCTTQRQQHLLGDNSCTSWHAKQLANLDFANDRLKRTEISEAKKCLNNSNYNDQQFLNDYKKF